MQKCVGKEVMEGNNGEGKHGKMGERGIGMGKERKGGVGAEGMVRDER